MGGRSGILASASSGARELIAILWASHDASKLHILTSPVTSLSYLLYIFFLPPHKNNNDNLFEHGRIRHRCALPRTPNSAFSKYLNPWPWICIAFWSEGERETKNERRINAKLAITTHYIIRKANMKLVAHDAVAEDEEIRFLSADSLTFFNYCVSRMHIYTSRD